MPEELVGAFPAIVTRGWKGDLHCHLVFTNERLIVSVKGLLAQAASSMGVFGTVGGAAAYAMSSSEESEKRSDLKRLSPDEILRSNKKNYDVPYSKVSRVQVGKKLGTSRLYIHTDEDVHKFKFQGVKLEQVETGIRTLLPGNVTVQMVDKLED